MFKKKKGKSKKEAKNRAAKQALLQFFDLNFDLLFVNR